MYAADNYRTKKTFKAMCLGKDAAQVLTYDGDNRYWPDDVVFVEGPWYPEPHRWYAEVHVENGQIEEIK